MVEEKNVTSSSWPRKSNIPSNMGLLPTHKFDFPNTVDDPIEVEEVEDPSENSEQELAFAEEASNEEDPSDISSAPGSKIETT